MLIIIDAGHGINTPGKCSPDLKFKEWKYCREMATVLTNKLIDLDYGVVNLMYGIDKDESLTSRCKRINAICKGRNDCIVISLHNNAAGAGQWLKASGWSVFVSMNASNNSKQLASLLCDLAIKLKVMGNRSIPSCKYWQKNLAICRDTNCPAVLVENMFMDNREDVAFLESKEGKDKLVLLIIDGIGEYKKLKNL